MTYRVVVISPKGEQDILHQPYTTFNAAVTAARRTLILEAGEHVGITHTGEYAGIQRVK